MFQNGLMDDFHPGMGVVCQDALWGERKACGRFTSSSDSDDCFPAQCGGLIEVVACGEVTGLSGSAICNASGNLDITWSWQGVSGATIYRIQMDNNSDFSSLEKNVTMSATFTNMGPDRLYARVKVEATDGSCAKSDTWEDTANVVMTCADVSCSCPGTPGDPECQVTWVGVEDGPYDVFRCQNSGCTGGSAIVNDLMSDRFTDDGVSANITYGYRVRINSEVVRQFGSGDNFFNAA